MKTKPHIVIIGAGTAGIMLANKLSRVDEVLVTVIDNAEYHYYQPGFLFYPFGKYQIDYLRKKTSDLINNKVYLLNEKAKKIDSTNNTVKTEEGTELTYDALVIATGTKVDIKLTEGMGDAGWRDSIFDFYTPDGAECLRSALQKFNSGKLVVQITEMPIKCPVAPLEFIFLADEYFNKRGIREQVELIFTTPLSGAFTKPVASDKLGHLLTEKNISVETDFYTERIDGSNKTLYCYDGRTVQYDLLVTIPTNVGSELVVNSELGDDLGFLEVNPYTLQSTKAPNIFGIGDATNVATSKAGSVAHFEADVLQKNILSYLTDSLEEDTFDGHSNCFVEVGGGKALLLDFNYDTQPYEGNFPFSFIGPMKLLKPTRINHIGKLAFRFIYWYMLLPGRPIPFIPNKMSIKGKKITQ